jgi:hypothetical protein
MEGNRCVSSEVRILPTYNTGSLTVREEHKLRVYENRVLRIFGPKRARVTGGWRKLHNEELLERKVAAPI